MTRLWRHALGSILASLCLLSCGAKQAVTPPPAAAAESDDKPVSDANGTISSDTKAKPEAKVAAPPVSKTPAPNEVDRVLLQKAAALLADNPDNALAAFLGISTQNSGYYLAQYNAAVIYQQRNDKKNATQAYQESLRAQPNFAPAAAGLASVLEASGQVADAEALLRRQAGQDPNQSLPHAALAVLLARTNRLDQAHDQAIEALRLDERSSQAMLALGMAYRRQKKFELSTLAINQALEVDNNLGEAYNELGLVLLAQDDKQKAVQAFQRAADASPGVPAILNNLGVLQSEVGGFKAAIESLTQATQLQPERADYYLNLGNALRGDQQYGAAETAYKKCLELKQGMPGALYNLAILYLDNDIPGKDNTTRLKESLQYFARFREAAPAADSAHLTEYEQMAQKSLDSESKRMARDQQRKEKEAKKRESAAAAAPPPAEPAAPSTVVQPAPVKPSDVAAAANEDAELPLTAPPPKGATNKFPHGASPAAAPATPPSAASSADEVDKAEEAAPGRHGKLGKKKQKGRVKAKVKGKAKRKGKLKTHAE